MARKTSIFRELAVAKALAEGVQERELARRLAEKWQLQRGSVRKMIKRLLRMWKHEPHCGKKSLSPWKTSTIARERMNVLSEALANGEARGDVVRTHAELWGLTEVWIDELITRVIAESQDEIHAQAQRELAMYIARIRSSLAKYAEVKDYPPTSKAYERLTLLTKEQEP